jgi:hypothetical protein
VQLPVPHSLLAPQMAPEDLSGMQLPFVPVQ